MYIWKFLVVVSLAACVWVAEWLSGNIFTSNNTDAVVVGKTGLREGIVQVPAVREVPNSTDYIRNTLNLHECDFCSAFEDILLPYSLNGRRQTTARTKWRNKAKKLTGTKKGAHKVDVIFQHLDQMEYAYQKNASKPVPPLTDRRLTFVHIGKAGGSTVRCSMRIGKVASNHCTDKDEPLEETAISRHVNCLTHEKSKLECYYRQGKPTETNHLLPKGNDYLVNLRNPLDRIASWFYYEHTENHEFVHPKHKYHCGGLVLNSCYRSFDDLIEVGLSFPKPRLKKEYLPVSLDLSAEECSKWAWATVMGTVPADNHNWYNYDWYAHRMLYDERSNKSDIFALRMEHLEQDWSTVDRMLGGNGDIPSNLLDSKNRADEKPFRVQKNKTHSEQGIANLCRAMCPEIQVYKKLLARAINLTPEDIEVSMEELRKQCPEEVSIEPRKCF